MSEEITQERIADLRMKLDLTGLYAQEIRPIIDALEAAQAKIAELEGELSVALLANTHHMQAQRGAVVVPEITPSVMAKIADSAPRSVQAAQAHWCKKVTEWFRDNLQSIPADRVLGEGEEKINRKEIAALRLCSSLAADFRKRHLELCVTADSYGLYRSCEALGQAIDDLRAQAGEVKL